MVGDLEIALRVLNAAGCLFALWILNIDGFHLHKSWSLKTQDHWLALNAWVFVGLTGAIEAVVRGIEMGPTTIVKVLAIALTVRALLRRGIVSAERTQPPWKKD